MNQLSNKKIILLFLIIFQNIFPVTFVYNLRISESTRRPSVLKLNPNTVISTFISQFRKRKDGIKQKTIGSLNSFIYSKNKFTLKLDFAFANVSTKQTNFSRTQTDDLLFTAAYNVLTKENVKLTFSGLVGVPTHGDDIIQGIQFGTGHYAIGAQADLGFKYSNNNNNFIFSALRLLHFFPRTLHINVPILPTINANFDLGNAFDFLISHQFSWAKRHRLEMGYNLGVGFGTKLDLPQLPIAIPFEAENFMRSSFYANYLYGFLIKKKYPSGFALGISYSFDHKPELIGAKYVFTIWGGWGINF